MGLKGDVRGFATRCGIEVMGFTTAEPFENSMERMVELESYYRETGKGHTPFGNRQFRARMTPREFLPNAKSMIVVAEPIAPGNVVDKSTPGRPCAIRASNYSRKGQSWYEVLESRIHRLAEFIREKGYEAEPTYGPRHVERRTVRSQDGMALKGAAVRAGVAKFGKNSIVHNDTYGSYMVLSAILTDAVIEPDKPSDPESDCEKCNACQKACPHGALDRPYVVDIQNCALLGDEILANRELAVPQDRRFERGKTVLGCDRCQVVCPKNFDLPAAQRALSDELDPERLHPDCIAELNRDLRGGGRSRFLLAVGNAKDPAAIGLLSEHLADRNGKMEPRNRIYAAWALGAIEDPRSTGILKNEMAREDDPMVREEIVAALRSLGDDGPWG